jgi:hypothetical protein
MDLCELEHPGQSAKVLDDSHGLLILETPVLHEFKVRKEILERRTGLVHHVAEAT